MATLPVILLNGTTADANQVMADFNEIYSNIDSTNVASGNKTGTGKFVLQTSPTVTTPTIGDLTNMQHDHHNAATGGILSGSAFSGSTTGTGLFVLQTSPTIITPTIASFVNSVHNHENNAGGGQLNIENVATSKTGTGAVVLAASPSFSGTPVGTGGFAVSATQKLWLDGGGDTYLIESSANVIDVFAGATSRMTISGASVITTVPILPATDDLYSFGTASFRWISSFVSGQSVAGRFRATERSTTYEAGKFSRLNSVEFMIDALTVAANPVTVNASYNLGSISLSSPGGEDQYDIVFSTPMDHANYIIIGCASEQGASEGHMISWKSSSKTTTGVSLTIINASDSPNDVGVQFTMSILGGRN